MKSFNSSLLALGLGFSVACGGGSSSPSTDNNPPPPPPPSTFSFKVYNEDDCGLQTPLSDVEFLIYDESPRTNPNTGFTTVTSNASGIVELDPPVGELMSFTINHIDADGRIISYSFVELASNQYNMALTFSPSDACECETINVDAQIEDSLFISDIRDAGLFGGDNLLAGYVSVNENTISHIDVSLCNDDFSQQPVISTAELYNYDDRIIYGVVNNPTSVSEPILLDKTELKVNKPDLGEAYSIGHSLIYNDQYYSLTNPTSSLDSMYAQFAQESPEAHEYSLSAGITGTFNGFQDGEEGNYVSISKRRTVRQSSSDVANVGSLPTGSNLNISFNTETSEISWNSDSAENFSLSLFMRAYKTTDNLRHRFYLYSPTSESIVVPKNKSDIESYVSEGELYASYFGVISTDTTISTSEHLNARRFSDSNGTRGFVNENSIFNYFILSLTPTANNKTKSNKSNLFDTKDRNLIW